MKIELQHIHKRFGAVHANNDISLTLNAGRIVGILGENGAGKSTLMKILSGYHLADSGEIIIDDRPVHYQGPRAAIANGIGMLQQDPLDVGAFTVLENLVFQPGQPFIFRGKQPRQYLVEANQRFGFDLDPDALIETLSVAQRQQLEIVRLLALGVKALILDEPTTGISAEQKGALFTALRDLAQRDGMIILLVSHKLEDVIELCDEAFVLRAGRLVGQQSLPASTQALVQLMFGQALAPQPRPAVAIGSPVLTLTDVHLKNNRLDMPHIEQALHASEVVGLAGLDGSGQALFMRACAGLEPSISGHIHVNGSELTRRPYRAFMGAGVAFAASGRVEEGLIADLTLTEHMALMMDRRLVIDWKAAHKQMDSQIAHYDIRGKRTDAIQQLSGGNQQRVLMALLPEAAKLLILEQPTRGLDVESATWIWEQLLIRRKTGTAILFSSDDLDEIVTYSDRILVFYAGRIREVPNASQTSVDELGHLIGGSEGTV